MKTLQAIDREILRIAVPSIVSNITVPLLGLMDVAITGHLGGAAYVGAIAVGGMSFNIMYWLFAFLRMGTSGMTAQAFGARCEKETNGTLRQSGTGSALQHDETIGVLRQASIVALAISAALLILQTPIRDAALWLIDPSAEVHSYARAYYNICIWGAPAVLMLYVLNGWYIGMQNSRVPMLVAIVQNVANIALSLLFVYGCGMKIEGVALGTVLAQYVGLAISIAALLSLKAANPLRSFSLMKTRSILTAFRRDTDTAPLPCPVPWLKFFAINRDIFLRTLCLIFVHFYFIAAGARFGDTALAVNALLMQLYLLYSYIMDGFAFAGEALVGKAVGALDKATMSATVARLFIWGAAMIAVFTLLYSVAGQTFLSLLSDDADVTSAAMEYSRWALLFPVCGMAAFVWDGIYIGATASKGMLLSMAAGMAAFFACFQTFSHSMQNHGLWLAFCCYIAARGIVQTIYFRLSAAFRLGNKPREAKTT